MKLSKLILGAALLFSAQSLELSAKAVIADRSVSTISIDVKTDKKTKETLVFRLNSEKSEKPDFKKAIKLNDKLNYKNDLKNKQGVIFSGASDGKILIEGLEANSSYAIDCYVGEKFVSSVNAVTLAKEPTQQSKALAFKNVTSNQIGVLWPIGDGEGRIVCVCKAGDELASPKDGVAYKPGKYGEKSCQIENSKTYVVFDSKVKNSEKNGLNETLISDLEEGGEYTIQSFEYNGSGESVNYKVEKIKNANPRNRTCLLPAPKALNPKEIREDGFLANWSVKSMKNINHFEMDLSTDPKFSTFYDIYNGADVGDLDIYEFVELPAGVYYYRLKAVSINNYSEYSNTIKVEIKGKK
jgi:hypothetical protein